MARGGNGSSQSPLQAGDMRAERLMHLTAGAEVISGSDLPRGNDEDLRMGLDAMFGQHPSQMHFALVELDPAEVAGLSADAIESPDYWCEVCAEEAEDEDEAAELIIQCQIERRQQLEEYVEAFEAGTAMDPPVIDLMDDGLTFHVFDGYHRLGAAQAAGVKRIKCHLLLPED